jgi:hypothetical protein
MQLDFAMSHESNKSGRTGPALDRERKSPMTDASLLDDITLHEHYTMRFPDLTLAEAREELWTVYSNIHGKLVMVQGGLEATFREGEQFAMIGPAFYEDSPTNDGVPVEEWACHKDPEFIRPCCQVTPREENWDVAAAFIRQHVGGPLPPEVVTDWLGLRIA